MTIQSVEVSAIFLLSLSRGRFEMRDSYIALRTGCQQIATDLNRIKRYTSRLAPPALYNTATGDQWRKSRNIATACRRTSEFRAPFESASNPDSCARATRLRRNETSPRFIRSV